MLRAFSIAAHTAGAASVGLESAQAPCIVCVEYLQIEAMLRIMAEQNDLTFEDDFLVLPGAAPGKLLLRPHFLH